MGFTVLLTGLFVLIVAIYGQIYPGELLVGYLGFMLQGCAFIALDLFISGCTSNQVTAVVAAFGANFVVWMLDLIQSAVNIDWVNGLLSFFSLYERTEPFLMGQLSFASVGYDLAFAAAFILLTIHHMDSRRYRGA